MKQYTKGRREEPYTLATSAHESLQVTQISTFAMKNSVGIFSLEELEIEIPKDIHQHLSKQYEHCGGVEKVIQAMKRPPASTICRVNQIKASRQEVIDELKHVITKIPQLKIEELASVFDDVVCIVPKQDKNVTKKNSLFSSRIPNKGEVIFPEWPSRKKKGWSMTHRVVICDRFCGEAVLRGSDIFVRGVLCSDLGIQEGESVAVYADIRGSESKALSRGLALDHYVGKCVFLGLGKAARSRNEIFRLSQGVAVYMSQEPRERAGPCLPPMSGILQEKMMLQNLPSIVVGHALDPKPNEVILDMCSAPGGKSSHLASLVRNKATIVACDQSRKKMVAAKELFQRFGATCIVPIALDSTNCVERGVPQDQHKSAKAIIDSAPTSEKYGLKTVKHFFPESFDRILLDPPCSALGLRPKLFVVQNSLEELQKHAAYQRKFVKEAVCLLKPSGIMTYSTCTMNASENEAMVRHILDNYPCMKLLPIRSKLGQPGLAGYGLDKEERDKVRRFDPHDEEADTMGFFVALFKKTQSSC